MTRYDAYGAAILVGTVHDGIIDDILYCTSHIR